MHDNPPPNASGDTNALGISTRISNRVPIWRGLSGTDRRILVDYFANDGYGKLIRKAAVNDDFAVWLTVACAEFHRLCGYRPVEPGKRHFRRRYDEGRTPTVAAKLDLHLRPMVQVLNGELQCPLCDQRGSLCREDTAMRRSALHLEHHTIYVENVHGNFRNGSYHCVSCGTVVQLPFPVRSRLRVERAGRAPIVWPK